MLALSPWYSLAVVAVVWRGFWIGIGISAWMTLINELVPEHLLSRVMSFDFFGSFGLTPVGFVLAGIAATAIRADDDPRGRGRARGRPLVRAPHLAEGAGRGLRNAGKQGFPRVNRGAEI